jgi:hypothetical protein
MGFDGVGNVFQLFGFILLISFSGLVSILCGALTAKQECCERTRIVIVIVFTVIVVFKSFLRGKARRGSVQVDI